MFKSTIHHELIHPPSLTGTPQIRLMDTDLSSSPPGRWWIEKWPGWGRRRGCDNIVLLPACPSNRHTENKVARLRTAWNPTDNILEIKDCNCTVYSRLVLECSKIFQLRSEAYIFFFFLITFGMKIGLKTISSVRAWKLSSVQARKLFHQFASRINEVFRPIIILHAKRDQEKKYKLHLLTESANIWSTCFLTFRNSVRCFCRASKYSI